MLIKIFYLMELPTIRKKKIFNHEYSKTLKKISKDYRIFYEGSIARDITKKVGEYKNNNSLSESDLKNFSIKKKMLYVFFFLIKSRFVVQIYPHRVRFVSSKF